MRKNLTAFTVAILVSLSVYGAAVWVGSQYIETFQNGFLFGNFNILKVSNGVPEYEDASGNVKRLDDRSKQIIEQEDFESDVDSADFLCGTNLTASNETTAPIAGNTSIDIDQGATAASAAAICDSQPITLNDKAQGKFVGVCFYSMWDGNDNEMAINIVDNTNTVELVQIPIRASTKPLEHCGYFNTATDTATVDYDIEVLTGNNNTTLRIDDLEFKVDPLAPTDIYASSEWEDCGLIASDFQGVGTPTSIDIECRRDGGDLLMRGGFVTGTVTTTEFRMNIKNGLTIGGQGSYIIPSGKPVRHSTSNTVFLFLATQGNTYLQLGLSQRTTTFNESLPFNGDNFASSETISFGGVRIPIAGWSDTAQGVVVKNRTSEYDWQSYTPIFSNLGSVTSVDVRYKIEGDSLRALGSFVCGTPVAATASIGLPSGMSQDQAKISQSNYVIIGDAARDVSTGDNFLILGGNGGTTAVNFGRQSGGGNTASTGGAFCGLGDVISFNFSVPIAGRKESDKIYTVPVDSLTGNYVRAAGNSGTAITSGNAFNFTETSDSANAFSGTVYTVQKSNSEVTVSGQAAFTTGTSGQSIVLYKNGSEYRRASNSGSSREDYDFTFTLNRGETTIDDTLSIRFSTAVTLTNSITRHYLNITESYGDRGIFLGTFGQPTCYVQNQATASVASLANTSSVLALTNTNGSCSFVSLASNQITLDAGTYEIKGFGQASGTSGTMIYLTDTAGTVIPPCVSNGFNSGSSVLTHGSFGCQVTLSTSTTYEQREWTQGASASGLCQIEHAGTGNAASYTVCNRLEITKVR